MKILWVIGLIVADIWTKLYFVGNYELMESVVVNDYLSMTYVHNYGAAFSIMGDMKNGALVLLIISIVGSIGLLWWGLVTKNNFEKTAILIMFSGSVGNLIDRWQNGYVVDFIDMHYGSLNWPIFNVADICISIGAVLLIIYGINENKKEKNN